MHFGQDQSDRVFKQKYIYLTLFNRDYESTEIKQVKVMICPKLFYAGEIPAQPFRRTHTPDSAEKESASTKTRNIFQSLRRYIETEVETMVNEMYYQNKDYEEGL